MIELKLSETKTEYFIIGSEIASKLEITEGNTLLAKNPINDKRIAGETKIDDSVEEKNVLISRRLFESIGFDEGSDVVISAYEKEVKKPVEATFEVKNLEQLDRDPQTLVKEYEEEFIDFINNRIWTNDSELL